jgi:hypothetical protein
MIVVVASFALAGGPAGATTPAPPSPPSEPHKK